jgi:hypothetical protein
MCGGELFAKWFVGERPGERDRLRRREGEVPAGCAVLRDALEKATTVGTLAA